jgi:hypothetical protein
VSRSLSREEMETIIGRTLDEPGWDVYTCEPVWKRKLTAFCAKHNIPVQRVDADGIRATVPIQAIRLSLTVPPAVPRELSPAQIAAREAFSARRKAQAARKDESGVSHDSESPDGS